MKNEKKKRTSKRDGDAKKQYVNSEWKESAERILWTYHADSTVPHRSRVSSSPTLGFLLLVVNVGSHRHTTFQLLVFKVRGTIATGGKHRMWTFDNFPPRFPFWDRLCLRRQPQVVKKAKAAQLQPMGRPKGLKDPSLKHAGAGHHGGGVRMAGCVYLARTASERGRLGEIGQNRVHTTSLIKIRKLFCFVSARK